MSPPLCQLTHQYAPPPHRHTTCLQLPPDEPCNAPLFTTHNLELTQPLLNMLNRFNMKMTLPLASTKLCTHSTGNHTRVDNIFCSEGLLDTIIKCHTDDATHPIKTNHYPIITTLDVHSLKAEQLPRYNFCRMDWPWFLPTLKASLDKLPQLAPIDNIGSFNHKLTALNTTIWDSINEHLEVSKLTLYSKRWWSTTLAQERKNTIKLAQKAKKFRDQPNHPIHKAHHLQRNKYSDHIKKAKANHWINWLEGLDKSSMWQAAKFISSPSTDAARAQIPTLQVIDPVTKHTVKEAHNNKEKSNLLHATSFPTTNPNLTPPEEDFQYPPPRWTFNNVLNELIHRAIDNLKPYKAMMSGTVPNSVLKYAKDLLVPHLGPLYRATNSLKYYPPGWSLTETLVLKKPGKPDYTIPSAWCPIVLSNGLAQLLNTCQALNIVTMCEKLRILLANHFGAWPGWMTTDSIHLLTKTVKDAWWKIQVASTLFLDVKGAFPSVNIKCFIHNLSKRGIPNAEWYVRQSSCQTTRLSFDGFHSDLFNILNGLDQGDPYSGILYLLYNSDLPSIADLKTRRTPPAFHRQHCHHCHQ